MLLAPHEFGIDFAKAAFWSLVNALNSAVDGSPAGN